MNSAPKDWQEVRRLHAWHLLQQGWSQRQIAAALGGSAGAVSQWRARAREEGPEALRRRPRPGAPCRVTAKQRARLPALLHRGADADGLRGQVWTWGRLAAVIHLACGLAFHAVHVGRLLNATRWSPQKPVRRARPRDDAAITRWREETWPALNRGPKPRDKRSSAAMRAGAIPCPVSSAPMPR